MEPARGVSTRCELKVEGGGGGEGGMLLCSIGTFDIKCGLPCMASGPQSGDFKCNDCRQGRYLRVLRNSKTVDLRSNGASRGSGLEEELQRTA